MPQPSPSNLRLLCFASMLVYVFGFVARANDAFPGNPPNVKGSALPESHLLGADSYPDVSVRLHEQGRGLIEFSVSPTGRASDIAVVSPRSTDWPPRLEAAALQYLGHLEFSVPASWGASGGTKHRYRFSFIFLLRPCSDGGSCEDLAPFPADYSVTVIAGPVVPPEYRDYLPLPK